MKPVSIPDLTTPGARWSLCLDSFAPGAAVCSLRVDRSITQLRALCPTPAESAVEDDRA